jgi:hypothetical protein
MQRGTIILAGLLALVAGAQPEARTLNGFALDGALVPHRQILSGGPPRDGIPAVDSPEFVGVGQVGYLDDDDRVLGIDFEGAVRAYPVDILNWHEIVNDRVGDVGVLITYCPLCGSGMAFRVDADARFGVSGLLYNSDMLLYDRATESLWSQIMGQAIAGPSKGRRLDPIPVRHTSWKSWREIHPTTSVLSRRTGHAMPYGRYPYGDYERSRRLRFPVGERNKRYHPKEWVIGIDDGELVRAYPLSELAQISSPLRDQVGDREFLVHFDAQDRSGWIEEVTPAGGVEIPSVRAFWFAWYAFHPDGEVFQAEPSESLVGPSEGSR